MSKPRLPLSVVAALGLSATGLRCGPEEVLQPCLSIAPMPYPDADSDNDTSAHANERNNEQPEPEMTVCLSIAPPDRLPTPTPPTEGDKSETRTVDKAKQAVLKRGILPADVADRLLRDRKD